MSLPLITMKRHEPEVYAAVERLEALCDSWDSYTKRYVAALGLQAYQRLHGHEVWPMDYCLNEYIGIITLSRAFLGLSLFSG